MRIAAWRSVRRIAGASRVVRPVTFTSLDAHERGVAQPQDSHPSTPRSGDQQHRRRARKTAASNSSRARDRGSRHCSSKGNATSPSSWTSGSSTTPNRSRTRRRPSAISASTSRGGRVAAVLDEVRVLGREPGAADLAGPCSRRPRAAARRCGPPPRVVGVLEGGAEGLDAGGLGLLAPRPQVGERRLHRLRDPARSSANDARATTSRGPDVRAPVLEAQLAGLRGGRSPWGRRPRPTRAPGPARRRRRSRSSAPRRPRCRGC